MNKTTEQPNVLWICVDHWPAWLMGAAGAEWIRTPTLDRLARNGVRFSRAYAESPACIPARRTLMTGVGPRRHGDRCFNQTLPMPDLPAAATLFSRAGYQCHAVGKLHVHPQRDRIGFHDVLLAEEGRAQFGVTDDYELYLGDVGAAGRQFEGGMCTNDYMYRPWHLDERHHVTNWISRQMARTIQRRDPRRSGFWYLSYTHPHPPLAPLAWYLDDAMCRTPPPPLAGEWATRVESWPAALQLRLSKYPRCSDAEALDIRRAFAALCTHIDHQLRCVIGTLREEGLAENTIILFTSDHGDMLGDHGLWAKELFYEGSAGIPMILSAPQRMEAVGSGRVDDRLVGHVDVLPTLLDLCGIERPAHLEGLSMVGEHTRDILFGEYGEDDRATRMVHDGRYKMIYYPVGNRVQLFDLVEDPGELRDLSEDRDHAGKRAKLTEELLRRLWGSDVDWIRDGSLAGSPHKVPEPVAIRGFLGQRGSHWPMPPPSAGAS